MQLPLMSITVKRLPGGVASNFLHSLEQGVTVHLLPPAGDFTLNDTPPRWGAHLLQARAGFQRHRAEIMAMHGIVQC